MAKASAAFALILLMSTSVVRRTVYEWFLNSHYVLSLVALIAIWRHTSAKSAVLYLKIATSLWTGSTAVHWLMFAFRNLAIGRPFATATVQRLWNVSGLQASLVDASSALLIEVTVPRPWRVEAGQWVFLSVPKLGWFTGIRGHPFMISWWERGRSGMTISLLVRPRAGFTGALERYTNQTLKAFIDGPYGKRYGFGDYGTVIMFATGIGIAGHIPYIKELISGYNSCEVKTQRIRLVWEIEDRCKNLKNCQYYSCPHIYTD
jgi:predicted ferric reductase